MIDDEKLEVLISTAISNNMTITDPKLYDAVSAVATQVADTLIDLSYDDVQVMGEAQVVLEAIKAADPGVYDEMIDNVLRLISDALKLK
jgi:hypothetical protein